LHELNVPVPYGSVLTELHTYYVQYGTLAKTENTSQKLGSSAAQNTSEEVNYFNRLLNTTTQKTKARK
jgi:hypothetical protein